MTGSDSDTFAPLIMFHTCSWAFAGQLINGRATPLVPRGLQKEAMKKTSGQSASTPARLTSYGRVPHLADVEDKHLFIPPLYICDSQEEAKKKTRAERFNLPKSAAELMREAKEKAAVLAAETAEKKRQRGERFGTLSEVGVFVSLK